MRLTVNVGISASLRSLISLAVNCLSSKNASPFSKLYSQSQRLGLLLALKILIISETRLSGDTFSSPMVFLAIH